MARKPAKPPRDPRRFACKALREAVLATEATHGAKVITSYSEYRPQDPVNVGGSCSCCGAGARFEGIYDWWLVLRAGFCDSDGVFMSMLCVGPDGSGCFEDIKADQANRKPWLRDMAAREISDLLGDDVDGADALMDDFDYMGILDE